MTLLAPTLQAFFTERLLTQRQVSPHTITAYRDSLRLLLRFAQQRTGKPPGRLDLADVDAPLIAAFLRHLDHERGNSAATRNARLAAIHSLFRYAALRHPEHAASIARVLEIPATRHRKTTIAYLDRNEIDALLAAPDRGTWVGRRDHAMLLVAIQTGVRISELVNLTIAETSLTTGAHLRVIGKGNKERCAILTSETVAVLRAWLREREGQPQDPLFPTRRGGPLDTTGVRAPARQAHRHSNPRMPDARDEADHAAHTPAHQRDAAQSPERGYLHDRALARARDCQIDRDLPPRRQQAQTRRDRTSSTARDHTRPLPASRPAPRVPGEPMNHPGPR